MIFLNRSNNTLSLFAFTTFVIFVAFSPFLLAFDTAHTIDTFVHSRLDYCNSVYCVLLETHADKLPSVQLACCRSCRCCLLSTGPPILTRFWDFFHWLKLQESIEYMFISITYKLLQSATPYYLRGVITIQPLRVTQSSSFVTLLRPPVQSSVKITDRSLVINTSIVE